MPKNLKNVRYWVFDLDNTLYPYQCDLFAQVDLKMSEFIAQKLGMSFAEARKLQKHFFHNYGTTLHGLQKHHNVDADEYLEFTHDIDYSLIPANDILARQLQRLDGEKVIFTNGPRNHAEKTLKQLGISDSFSQIYDIYAANFQPKPEPKIYDTMLEYFQIKYPKDAIMLDDLVKNLVPAAKLGMKTVWVEGGIGNFLEGSEKTMIHFQTDRIDNFLNQVLA